MCAPSSRLIASSFVCLCWFANSILFCAAAPSVSPQSSSSSSSSSSTFSSSILLSRDVEGNDNNDNDNNSNNNHLLHVARDAAQDLPVAPAALGALRDPAYLPAQIGGIVGSYALSLVLVALILLCLARRRRDHLKNGEDDFDTSFVVGETRFNEPPANLRIETDPDKFPYPQPSPRTPKNFSYPTTSAKSETTPYIFPSPASTAKLPGVDFAVDQSIVKTDREMAQSQLEEMYKYVMEREEAKEAGKEYEGPPLPSPQSSKAPGTARTSTTTLGFGGSKKEKNKPANLNLSRDEKKESRASSLLSALRSPRKKRDQVKGVSISSPIMTPMSGTFPRGHGGSGSNASSYGYHEEERELSTIPPRQYAPPPPPPAVPQDQSYAHSNGAGRRVGPVAPLTPDMSPQDAMSIDERLGGRAQGLAHERSAGQLRGHAYGHAYGHSHSHSSSAGGGGDPPSAVSESSTAELVTNRASAGTGGQGLPTSPRAASTFRSAAAGGPPPTPTLPSLPSSPRPGSTFSRANAPTALRQGGALPLRAYEPALASPRSQPQVKLTTFERAAGGALSPGGGGAQTPYTGAAMPYSPYQPFSPVVPITPSLVTREDRKRMKRMVPKTPTMEMVQSSDEIW